MISSPFRFIAISAAVLLLLSPPRSGHAVSAAAVEECDPSKGGKVCANASAGAGADANSETTASSSEQQQQESSDTIHTSGTKNMDTSVSSSDEGDDGGSTSSSSGDTTHQNQEPERKPSLFLRPIRRLTNISVQEFNDEYSPPEKAVPIVFENAMNDVYDPKDWTKEAIIEECGHIPLIDPNDEDCMDDLEEAVVDDDCHSVRFVNTSMLSEEWAGLMNANLTELNITTLGDMMRLQDTPAGSHLYLHDAPMAYYCPPAVERIRVPKYFHTDYRNLENDPDLIDEMEVGHFPDIFISNKGTGSPLHADAHMTRFYFQLLSGKKLWRVLPPSEYWRAGPSIDEDDYYPTKFGADIINPDFEEFPDLDGALVYEAVLNPGDVIFVPEGWGHQIYNLEDSMATSMNFVDWHALPAFLRHKLHEKGPAFELSYIYRLMTSYLMPVDIPVAPDQEENIDIQDWLDNHHFSTLDVPASVTKFVEFRGQYRNGLDSYRSTDGFPALHVATMANYVAVVAYLLENGASLLEKDYKGRTALDLAEKLQHYEIVDEIEWHRRKRGSQSFRNYVDWYVEALF
eukprot:CAMPEP_0178599718 /NCGR_PEP_ID=MMETSP0697-20121206/33469_1 /TAXON_ID=265572 /ORGANISM="Extubocellulus spinifer, Strain CCMP396" /LENGTH=571 /DNA_ID=CAMNT_0020237659 /DNA_START=116 /DNA_END=1831 /DNA_ORIENTATION=+